MIRRIKKLLNELDGNLQNSIADIGGDLATGIARASGIPLVAGASDTIGQFTSDSIRKLFANKNDISTNLKSNFYFYKDDYSKYQSGSFGYDVDIPKDKFNPSELTVIKNLIYPSFKKFGYNAKFIGKRNDTNNYLLILFKGVSTIPIKDGKTNPIFYPFPFDLFKYIQESNSSEDSDSIVYNLLKTYNINPMQV